MNYTLNKQLLNTSRPLFCTDLPSLPVPEIGTVLVTGATGYIGGRLVPELLARGYRVRVMVRAPFPELMERWPGVELIVADALDIEGLLLALQGVHTAYYLIHSLLLGQKKFESVDLQAATNFRIAAENQDVKRIIYLSGLGNIDSELSPHLESRNKVAQKLAQGIIPVTVLRAGIIIGSGSASYEILENLVKNSPVFFIPSWARTRSQPIAIRDVIKYLVGVLELQESSGQVFDIGGNDILTYDQMLLVMARHLKKRRFFFPALINYPPLYGYIVGLLTPVPIPITKVLVRGCKNEVICKCNEIRQMLPFEPLTFSESLDKALQNEKDDHINTRWSDSYPPAHELAVKLHQFIPAPKYTSAYCMLTYKPASSLFKSFCNIGGKMGYFQSNWMWRLRGVIDRIFLGVGSSRGRRSTSELRINDVIDFFRVENIIPDKKLLLRAEMRLPGKAWLEFNIDNNEGLNKLTINAYFHPRGITGILYWYAFLPFHFYIFKDLLKQIERRSEKPMSKSVLK